MRLRREFPRNIRSRRGFTLLEVLTALTITALVTTIAGTALRASLDVRERVTNNRETLEAESRMRSWLTDMIRHAAPPTMVDGALFRIVPGNAAAGNTATSSNSNLPTDAVTLMTVGVEQPYGTGELWRVSLAVEIDGLHVRASPMSRNNTRASVETVLPHISGLRVEALEPGSATDVPAWRAYWPLLRIMPAAVRLTFIANDGTVRTPLVVQTSPFSSGTP